MLCSGGCSLSAAHYDSIATRALRALLHHAARSTTAAPSSIETRLSCLLVSYRTLVTPRNKPRRDDVRRVLLVVQDHGVGPDVLEQQRLDEVHAKSISARQAMRRDILRDVRVPAEVVREPRRPRGGKDVCLGTRRNWYAGQAQFQA